LSRWLIGIPNRTSKLRAYGNSIVPQAGAQIIGAYIEVMT
jgi:hypothetical protein